MCENNLTIFSYIYYLVTIDKNTYYKKEHRNYEGGKINLVNRLRNIIRMNLWENKILIILERPYLFYESV